jgi:hypothetical protein
MWKKEDIAAMRILVGFGVFGLGLLITAGIAWCCARRARNQFEQTLANRIVVLLGYYPAVNEGFDIYPVQTPITV